MGAKASSATLGYRYFMGLHMGLGRGPVNEIVEVRVGDLRAWPQKSTDYPAGSISTVDTIEQRDLESYLGLLKNIVHVTADTDSTKNGYWRKMGGTWYFLGTVLGGQTITGSGITIIDRPNLFGGDDKEGGIQGPLNVMMGAADQVCPSDLANFLEPTGAPVSGFRGVVTAWFNGLVCSMNPYPKSWAFRVRRYSAGWWQDDCWYPEKAMIQLTGYSGDGGDDTTKDDDYITPTVKAMNAAHIILECATNPEWGKGLPRSLVNLSSFRNAADQLYAEGFGLCMLWNRQDDIDVFVQTVCDHIAAAVYVDRATGLLTMKLIRNDYKVEELVTWTTENGLISIDNDETSSQDSVYNEVVVTFTEAVTGKQASVRAQNTASFQALGEIYSTTSNYPGIPTKGLAARVAQRDRDAQSIGLSKYTVKLNRKAWKIAPGSVFAVKDTKRNLGKVVLRALNVADGNDVDGTITILAVVDIFGMPATSYITDQPSGWFPPPRAPAAAPHYKLMEVPYRDMVRLLDQAKVDSITMDESFVVGLAQAPNGLALSYALCTKATGETVYAQHGAGPFCPTGQLNGSITPYQTAIMIDTLVGFDADNVGQTIMVDDEIMRVDSFNPASGAATVARGCADTIPAAHADNALCWFYENDIVDDTRPYAATEVISAEFLTITSAGALDSSLAPTASQTINLRQGSPYPPGQVRMNDGVTDHKVYDLTTSDVFTGDFSIKWVARNRVTEADVLIDESAGAVAAEAGTTYTIKVYDDANTLVRTDAAATSPWVYDSTKQTADGDIAHPRFELYAVRDGLGSYFKHSFVINRVVTDGFGKNWGINWGRR